MFTARYGLGLYIKQSALRNIPFSAALCMQLVTLPLHFTFFFISLERIIMEKAPYFCIFRSRSPLQLTLPASSAVTVTYRFGLCGQCNSVTFHSFSRHKL
jgi:hypothetical protein